MRYIQALKENKYDFSSLPKDIQKATKLVLKSKNYNSKIESLDLITFNSIRNSQPVDERIEDLYKLSKNDNPVEENNGFNTPASIDEVEEEFASGGHIAEKSDDNKVRQTKVRFHLGKGENFMKWKVENPKTKDVEFFAPDDVQLEMYNCKLTNSPKTAMKIFTGEMDKSPIAWVVCEDVDISSVVEPVDPDERLSYNPRTAPNWLDSDGDIVDNFVFEKLVTFGRGVYYEAPDGKLFALGGMAEESSVEEMASGKKIDENPSKNLAPNGKPSLLTHEEWHLVRTPAFKKWFGDWQNDPENSSKVVDTNGEPLVVFHGSRSEFNVFDINKSGESNTTAKVGFWFSPIKNFAENFASSIWYGKTDKEIILSVFLSVKNPKIYETQFVSEEQKQKYKLKIKDLQKESSLIQEKWIIGDWDYQDRMVLDYSIKESINEENYEYYSKLTNKSKDAIKDGILISEINKKIKNIEQKLYGLTFSDSYEKFRTDIYKEEGKSSYDANIGGLGMSLSDPRGTIKKYINLLTDNGNDGIIIKNTRFDKSSAGGLNDQYVVFNSNQIKLADGSNTTFDETNLDIRFETGGEVQKTSPDIYENNLLQIRVIGGDYAYYTKVNQEWKFLSESIVLKLKEGAKHELEHIGTIQAFKRKDIPNEIVATFIAYDHINEDINYYSKLDKAIPEQMATGKKLDSKTYTYALTIRPFDSENYPKQNFIRLVEEAPEYKYGLLEYSEPLDDTAIQHYSLAPVSEILQFDGTTLDYYEGNFAKVKIERDSYNTPTLIVDFYDKEINEKTHSTEFTGKQFREKINSGDWKIINPLPSVTESTNVANPNEIESLDSLEKLYDELIAKRDSAKTDKERKNLNNQISQTWNKIYFNYKTYEVHPNQPRKENIKETLMETTNEKPMENILDSYSGSALNWNNVPVRWRNIKAVRPVTFSINPYDKGLLSIVDVFTGDDGLRPIMSAIHFEDKGLVCTDAHKLLHLHYNHSDFKGNYPSLDSAKTFSKGTTKAQIEKELNEGKFPNWEAVIPRDSEFTYEIDTMKLYQYCKVALNYSNKTTHQVSFKYDKSNKIGFNGQFMIESLEAMMKIQKCPKVYIHITSPSRASVLSFTKTYTPTTSTYCLLMPVMANNYEDPDKPNQIYGAFDIDYNKSLSCYFDFTDSEIHNADTSIADYKESYGDSNEMPLELITLMDKFIKTAKTNLPILENVCIDGNGIRVDSLDARIEIANDWKIPQGLYLIDNNALIRNSFMTDLEDYPKLENRVSLKEPLFTMDSDVFKFYIEKAFLSVGTDEFKEALTGFALEYTKGSNFSLVSTDSKILFHANLMKYARNLKSSNFKIITGEVNQLINFAKNIDSKEISFYSDDYGNEGKYRISAGRLHFEAKKIYAKYPNWEGIIPTNVSKQLSFNIKDLYVCMNNEASKLFAKSEGLKPVNLSVYNQGDKIFLSNRPDPKRPEDLISKEICEMKIDRVTFPEPKTNNIYQNFVLLSPLTYTNGNDFNFGAEYINKIIAILGKEKVITEYTNLNSFYLFTSDNLDFNTSDVYKPVKTESKPSPVKNIEEMVYLIKPSELTILDQIVSDNILETKFEYNGKYYDYEKTSNKKGDSIRIEEYRAEDKKQFLSPFYAGTKIFETGKQETNKLGLSLVNSIAYFSIPLEDMPVKTEKNSKQDSIKRLNDKAPLPFEDGAEDYMKSLKERKPSGKNPSEFNVGDLIEYAGVLYEVKVPKTKDNFSKLINWSDYYRSGDIDEFANTEHTKTFKLVKRKSNKETFEVIKDVESLSPAFDTISSYTHEIRMYESAEDNNRPLQNQIIKVLNLKEKLLKFLKTKEIQENIIWTNDIKEALNYEQNLVDKLEKNYSPSSSVKKKEKEDNELRDAVRGLEALMKISKSKNDKEQIEMAVKGLKTLLK